MQPATPTAPILTRRDLTANVTSFARHAAYHARCGQSRAAGASCPTGPPWPASLEENGGTHRVRAEPIDRGC